MSPIARDLFRESRRRDLIRLINRWTGPALVGLAVALVYVMWRATA